MSGYIVPVWSWRRGDWLLTVWPLSEWSLRLFERTQYAPRSANWYYTLWIGPFQASLAHKPACRLCTGDEEWLVGGYCHGCYAAMHGTPAADAAWAAASTLARSSVE